MKQISDYFVFLVVYIYVLTVIQYPLNTINYDNS